MAASSSAQKTSVSPCGCGGSKSANTSPCSCGGGCGGTCSLCQETGYSRPRFFAGQLLTEDDLQQLNDYVVAKNRLHARHLFGSGVVCGLGVTCYPCGGGKVIVDPGYALDCCGNDIVIACPQELDINQMVRELQRKRHGGLDCGDPCKGEGDQGQARASVGAGGADTGKEPKPACQKYCLYVSYCEQSSDPVSPYATDDPCGTQLCEATRIREGFRFDLRCPDPTEPVAPLCERIHDCLGPAPEKYRNAAKWLQDYGARVVAFKESPKALHKNFEKTAMNRAELLSEALKEARTAPLKLVDAAREFGSDVALLAVLGEHDPKLQKATKLLADAAETLVASPIQEAMPTDLDRAYASSLAEMLHPAVRASALRTESAKGAPPEPVDEPIRLLAEKIVYGKQLHNELVDITDDLRVQLIFRLEQAKMKTRCDLLDVVNAAPKLSKATAGEIKMSDVLQTGNSAYTLGRAWLELEKTCYCNALNPPCQPCDDPGVLLACITVEQCRAKDICNLDRQFVLSPVATRYWIPEIARIGRAIQEACCPDPCPDKWKESKREYELGIGSFGSSTYASWVFRLVRTICPEPERTAEGLGTMVADVMETYAGARFKRLEESLTEMRTAHANLTDQVNKLSKQPRP